MIQSVARVKGNTGFAANSGRVLFDGVADADGAFHDEHGRACIGLIISAINGAARCTLTAGRGGEGGGFQVTRTFDVVPQFDAVLLLNYKTMRVQVEDLFDAATEVSYAVVYDYPSRIPRLRLYEKYTGGVAATVPAGAHRFTPDVADTWTWAIEAAGGAVMTQVLTGDATSRYPVLGQDFTPAVDNRVLWTLSQP